eukprot:Partr_v1_DN24052_c0_g1_i1_m34598 putative Endoplasmic reticulumgolgi intermediate compartment protein
MFSAVFAKINLILMDSDFAWVQRFDLFPKLDEVYLKSTRHGAYITALASIILSWLFMSEMVDFMDTHHVYDFLVDPTIESKLQISMDVTVAMPCRDISVDIIDVAGSAMRLRHAFQTTPATLNVDPLIYRDYHFQYNESIHGGSNPMFNHPHPNDLSIRSIIKGARYVRNSASWKFPWAMRHQVDDACRVHGSVDVNRVAGNLHITALGRGYFGPLTPTDGLNFTHVFDRLQFGFDYPGLENPLDYTYQVTQKAFATFSYFVSVIPTIYVDGWGNELITNQYSVGEHTREFETYDNTVPGIFIKFDIQPISVRVTESRGSFPMFLIRVAAVIGGFWRLFAWANGLLGWFL